MALGDSEFFVGDSPHQMYVQHLAPAGGTPERPCPLVLVHGAGHTGVMWTSTPDGRPGWAPYFAGHGWQVYVVDWPGVGRSGFPPDFLTMGAAPVVKALIALLEYIGPAAVIGHSMGGAMTYLAAERASNLVRVMVLAAPSAPANTSPVRPGVSPAEPVIFSRATAQMYAGGSKGPKGEVFEQYYKSLVPVSPSIMNAAFHQNENFWIEHPDIVRSRPILYIIPDEDGAVTPDRSEPGAAFLGVVPTRVGPDWGLPGHGHMLMIEPENLEVARHVQEWLEANIRDCAS